MPIARIDGRAAIGVNGAEAESFLQNLITADVAALPADTILAAALLTPQGKILFDFLVSRSDGGFWLDCRADTADDLLRRLTLYRLRAKVEFSLQNPIDVLASWQIDSGGGGWRRDSRFADIEVFRRYGDSDLAPDAGMAEWHELRIRHGVGESGTDYALADVFPHDVLLDQNGGVSFRKGCFVGQEVVSRMQHRGTARRRLLLAEGDGALPPTGTEITAGGRTIGALGSVAGIRGLALVRIDRAAAAMAGNLPILAGETPVRLSIPAWADFSFPAEPGGE